MHVFSSVSRKARKDHKCTYCGEKIYKGELYRRWANVDDCFFTNKCHHECVEVMGYDEYCPYIEERPSWRLTNLGLELLYEKYHWNPTQLEGYQRPVVFGYL